MSTLWRSICTKVSFQSSSCLPSSLICFLSLAIFSQDTSINVTLPKSHPPLLLQTGEKVPRQLPELPLQSKPAINASSPVFPVTAQTLAVRLKREAFFGPSISFFLPFAQLNAFSVNVVAPTSSFIVRQLHKAPVIQRPMLFLLRAAVHSLWAPRVFLMILSSQRLRGH